MSTVTSPLTPLLHKSARLIDQADKKVEEKVCPKGEQKIIKLSQADFNSGQAVFLDQPNARYVLVENVTVKTVAGVVFSIEITANNITFDLNGHTIVGNGSAAAIGISTQQNISILNGTLRNFFAAIESISSTNFKVKKLNILNTGDFGISIITSKYFSINRCKIDSISISRPGIRPVGIQIVNSSGKLRRCTINNLTATTMVGATGILVYTNGTTPQQVQMSYISISNITSYSLAGVVYVSFSSGGFEKSCMREVKISNLLATGVDQQSAGVLLESVQNLKLYNVEVDNVKATINSSSTGLNAFGFYLPDSNVKLVNCTATNVSNLVSAPAS